MSNINAGTCPEVKVMLFETFFVDTYSLISIIDYKLIKVIKTKLACTSEIGHRI
jgi:hypothetical protein